MAGPGDEVAAGAGGHGRLRASHADREQVIDVLKAAFVQGRLDMDEFGLRVGQALGSRTCAELAAVTADLPAGQAAARPPGPARVRGGQPVLRPGRVIGVATALYAGVWAVVILLPIPAVLVLTITSLLYYMIVVLIALGHMSASPGEMRSGGQAPPGPAPGAGGQGSRRPPSANPAGPLPPTDYGRQHTAEAARSRLPRPPLPGARSPRPWRPRGHGCAIGCAGR
jgi:hypothetical protein